MLFLRESGRASKVCQHAAHLHTHFPALRVLVGIGIQVKANHGKTVAEVKTDGGGVAALCLQHSHAGTMCLRNGNHMFQQSAANAAAAKRFHHQKVCDAKAVVSAFRAALHKPCQYIALKSAI